LACLSRRGCRFSEGCEVAPFVGLFEWNVVVSGISGIDLSGSMLGKKRTEGFIEKSRILQTRPQQPCLLNQ
jgi:hypothetical protein